MYLKHLFRHFKKDPIFFLLNLFGLVAGVLVFLLMSVILQSEFSYDEFHGQKDQIYRVHTHDVTNDDQWDAAITPHELAPLLSFEYPEVGNYARFYWPGEVVVQAGERNPVSFYESKVYRADASVFTLFDHKFLAGNPEMCLNEPNNMVLTQRLAEKYFGSIRGALNEILWIEEDGVERKAYVITAVVEDVPYNSHLRFDALIAGIPDRGMQNEDGSINRSRLFAIDYLYTYLLFKPGYNPAGFDDRMTQFYEKYYRTEEESSQLGSVMTNSIMSLTDLHFNEQNLFGDMPKGNVNYLGAFAAIVLLMLLMTAFNYVNLTSARMTKRFKVYAIRKLNGASNSHLIKLVLSEAVVIYLIAFTVGLLLATFLIKGNYIESFTKITFSTNYFFTFEYFAKTLFFTILLSLCSGIYPAFLLLRFLKTDANSVVSLPKNRMRKVLTTVQFAFSLIVVTLTFSVYQQLNHVVNKDLGYNYDGLEVLQLKTKEELNKAHLVKEKLSKDSKVNQVAFVSDITGEQPSMDVFRLFHNNSEEQNLWKSFAHVRASPEYVASLELKYKLKNSENFVYTHDDLKHVVINENAANILNITDLSVDKLKHGNSTQPINIIGIVENFNFSSLYHDIDPLIISISLKNQDNLMVKGATGDQEALKSSIRVVWQEFFPNDPIVLSSYKDLVMEQYKEDTGRSKLLISFCIWSLVIALGGFIGLSAYNLSAQLKQIMIRRVVGASKIDVLTLLIKENIIGSIAAGIIAVPVSYYLFNQWVQSYAYRITFDFLNSLVILLLFFLTLVFVVYTLARKTLSSNPSTVLKEE